MTFLKNSNDKSLDIVITWVDGDDPLLRKKRNSYQLDKDLASDAVNSTRFAGGNEIYYNVASIIKYVSFCRYIYIITDNQTPEFIDEFAKQGICAAGKIKIIDHKDIFVGYEQFLPTFNSRSIETMVCRIPELSDYFIYMNDDFFFNQSVTISDFLIDNKIVIHGHWNKNSPVRRNIKLRKLRRWVFGTPIQPRYVMAQMLSAKILGMKRFFNVHHYPHIIDKNILKNYLTQHPKFLEAQIKYKFRDVEQVNPITLMNHLKIKKDEAHLRSDIAINYVQYEDNIDVFIDDLHNRDIKFGCIQSLDLLTPDLHKKVSQAMTHKLAAYLPTSMVTSIIEQN